MSPAFASVSLDSGFSDGLEGDKLTHPTISGALMRLLVVPVALHILLLAPAARAGGDDSREDFEASVFLGYGIDSFAAGDLQDYLNPDDAGDVQERFIAGVNFAYRLVDRKCGQRQLWLYGKTVHGVRSTDVDCKANSGLSFCSQELDKSTGDEFLFVVRNASSLEAHFGLRWEFLTIREDGKHTANLYAKVQAGFLTVSDAGDDVIDVHHAGMGLLAIEGKLKGSYLELGYGKTDLFFANPDDRWKVDGFITWRLKERWGVHPFARLTLDSDFGDGSDSVQTYVGLDFDLDELFR
jgi:hypothetical protein